MLSPKINTGEFTTNNRKLGHSSFNLNWISELGLTDIKVIFDIGAYDCGDSIRFADIAEKVYSFEADPFRFNAIDSFIAEYPNIELYNLAVSNIDGDIEFYQSKCLGKDAGDTHEVGSYGGQGSIFKHNAKYKSLYDFIIQNEEPIIVKSVSLKTFCRERNIDNIDVAHIDVEGAEHMVMEGFGDVRPEILYIETLDGMFEGAPNTEELHTKICNMGYSLLLDLTSDRLYKLDPK